MPRHGWAIAGRALLIGLLFPATGRAVAAPTVVEPVVIELGDPRKTVVSIEDDGSTYSLAVKMLAVHSFDTGSDREANRSLARGSAMSALSKHLRVRKRQELSLGGLKAGGEHLEGDRFALAFTVPKEGVRVVDKPSAFAKVKLDPEFAGYLLADPLLMEVEGAKVRGATRDFPIVGRWTSDDGSLFSVAVGGFFSLLEK